MYHNDNLPDMSEAHRQVYEKNDGNLANNAPPYDKVTRRDVITGALGKDEMGGKRKKHDCAKKVNYKKEEWDTIPEQHTMLEDGTVTHYDLTNGETILENVPVEELEILISEKHEHFDNYDKNSEVLGEADSLAAMAARREKRLARQRKQMGTSSTGQDFGHDYGISSAERKKRQQAEFDKFVGKKTKKEAFAFSEEDLEELDLFGEEIDAMTDEELIDMMEDLIIETAEDIDDLIEICEHLEGVEMLAEVSDKYYDSAVKSSKAAAKANRPSRVERMKSAAKAAGSKLKAGAAKAGAAVKKGVKAAGKSAAANAGKAVGTFQANRIKAKRAELSKPSEKKKEAPKSSSSDDDGTGGKLDALLAKTRGTSSSSSSSSGGGGERDAGSEARERLKSKKKGPGLLRRAAGAVGRGLKKAVGKTARAVSTGSGKLAKRLGEDYDQIAHLYESGLFSIQEIENVIEEGYKEIDRSKENKMYRRAGNLARTGLSSKGKKKEDALNKSNKIVSAIARQKENERFKKMGDEKARDNYGG